MSAGDIGYPEAALLAAGAVLDRGALDPQHLADQGGNMPARLAAEYPAQGALLFTTGGGVQMQRHLPLGLRHVARRMSQQRNVESIEGDRAATALLDMPGNQRSAATSVEALRNTQGHAIAQLQVSK